MQKEKTFNTEAKKTSVNQDHIKETPFSPIKASNLNTRKDSQNPVLWGQKDSLNAYFL